MSPTDWDSTVTYLRGDQVVYQGHTYEWRGSGAIIAAPPREVSWEPALNEAPNTGQRHRAVTLAENESSWVTVATNATS